MSLVGAIMKNMSVKELIWCPFVLGANFPCSPIVFQNPTEFVSIKMNLLLHCLHRPFALSFFSITNQLNQAH